MCLGVAAATAHPLRLQVWAPVAPVPACQLMDRWHFKHFLNHFNSFLTDRIIMHLQYNNENSAASEKDEEQKWIIFTIIF